MSEARLKQFELTRRWSRLPVRGRYRLYWRSRPNRQVWEPGAIACLRTGLNRRFFYSLDELEAFIEILESEGAPHVD